MRLIHTADWHLGRLFHGVHLTDDQAIVLEELVELAKDQRADAVLVAGDVYDRAVPPPEAVSLLSETLARLVRDAGTTVIVIAGNHDSARRLEFASGLLAEQRLHIVGRLPESPAPIVLADERGPVAIHPLPYADPVEVRARLGGEIHDHAAAMRALCARTLAARPADGSRSVCLAHAFVAGGVESPQSERPLSVGGSGQVPASVFDGFDYVALGHLHGPQPHDATHRLRYAGSLLKYSFDEHTQHKSVSVVELGPPREGGCSVSVERVELSPRRDVRRLRGTMAELLLAGRADPRPNDYIEAEYTDKGPILEPMAQLRDIYPNALSVHQLLPDAPTGELAPVTDHRALTDLELFEEFWRQVTEEEFDDAERDALLAVLGDLERRRRNA